MNRFAFALRHGWASAIGWLRLAGKTPAFASTLLAWRARYFITRNVRGRLLSTDGFQIDSPDTLVAYWSMFVERELYHPAWVRPVIEKPRPFVLDIGANAGMFSHYVRVLNPNAVIEAFEPIPAMADRVRELAKRTGAGITVHPFALSDAPGEALFQKQKGHEGVSRIVATGQASPGTQTFRVKVETVDRVVQASQVDVLKVDVEGHELQVLEGAQETLARTQSVIIEAHSIEELKCITKILGGSWDRFALGPSDYLFIRRS